MSYHSFGTPLKAAPRGLGKEAKPRIHTKSVPCPNCKAQPEQPCVNAAGDPMAGGHTHKPRARMARRKLNAEREAASIVNLPTPRGEPPCND